MKYVLIPAVILTAVLSVYAVGYTAGQFTQHQMDNKEAIAENHARYNPKTAEFEWMPILAEPDGISVNLSSAQPTASERQAMEESIAKASKPQPKRKPKL